MPYNEKDRDLELSILHFAALSIATRASDTDHDISTPNLHIESPTPSRAYRPLNGDSAISISFNVKSENATTTNRSWDEAGDDSGDSTCDSPISFDSVSSMSLDISTGLDGGGDQMSPFRRPELSRRLKEL